MIYCYIQFSTIGSSEPAAMALQILADSARSTQYRHRRPVTRRLIPVQINVRFRQHYLQSGYAAPSTLRYTTSIRHYVLSSSSDSTKSLERFRQRRYDRHRMTDWRVWTWRYSACATAALPICSIPTVSLMKRNGTEYAKSALGTSQAAMYLDAVARVEDRVPVFFLPMILDKRKIDCFATTKRLMSCRRSMESVRQVSQ